MPQVPYQSVPRVAPTREGTPFLRTPQNLDVAFGIGVAKAVEGFGRELEGGGDKLFAAGLQLQAVQNETRARQAAVDADLEVGQKHAEFSAKQGQEQVDAYPQYQQDLKDILKKHRDGISNPAAQRLYDGESFNILTRAINSGAAQTAVATKQAAKQVLQAQTSAAVIAAGNDFTDSGFQSARQRIISAEENTAKIDGITDPLVIQQNVNKRLDLAFERRVEAIAKNDPFAARKLFETNQSNIIDPNIRDNLDSRLKAAEVQRGAGLITQQVTSDLTAETSVGKLEDSIKAGVAEAEKRSPGNVELQKAVEGQIISKHNRLQAVARDNNRQDVQDIGNFINGGDDPKNAVKDMAVLMADPRMQEIYTRLPPAERQKVDAFVKHNARMDSDMPSQEKDDNYSYLLGLWGSEKTRTEFNAKHIELDENLTKMQRADLISKQKESRKALAIKSYANDTLADPNVKSMLMEAGILDKTTGRDMDKVEATRYRGMLEAAIRNRTEETGKPLTVEEKHKIAYNLLHVQVERPGIFGGMFGKNKEELYKGDLPEPLRQMVIKKLKQEGESDPSDEQIMSRFLKGR